MSIMDMMKAIDIEAIIQQKRDSLKGGKSDGGVFMEKASYTFTTFTTFTTFLTAFTGRK